MSRSRELANLANNATGLETLTVSDITDLTSSATELNYLDGVTGTGISNNNLLKANANVADNDFLRVDGTSVEGRTTTEMLSDLGSGTPGATNFLRGDGSWQGAGKILQVQYMTYSTEETTTSTSFVSTSITDQITPSSTDNKILVLWTVPARSSKNSASTASAIAYSTFAIDRGGTDITSSNFYIDRTNNPGSDTGEVAELMISGSLVDSPSSTSALTYTYQHKSLDTSRTTYSCRNNQVASMTLIEIAG